MLRLHLCNDRPDEIARVQIRGA